jgi:hypothetical protein
MNTRKAALQLLEEFEFLFEKYSQELRATTQPYYLARVANNVKGYAYHPEDALIRETLLEHIGSLPMVATTLYPYIADDDVDLGQSLIMLAIHDIGELVTGDEMTFTKKAASKLPESEAALKLLHSSYHETYRDVESQSTQTAKFAKAVDKITPDIFDYLTPADITIWRFKHFVGIEPSEIMGVMLKHKRPYMLWNPFMTEFHKVLYEKLEAKLRAVAK